MKLDGHNVRAFASMAAFIACVVALSIRAVVAQWWPTEASLCGFGAAILAAQAYIVLSKTGVSTRD